MKPMTCLLTVWSIMVVGMHVILVNPACAASEQVGTRFPILSGEVEVVAQLVDAIKHSEDLPSKKELPTTMYCAFEIFVTHNNETFTIHTALTGVETVEYAVSLIREGIRWESKYLFVSESCGGGNAWTCDIDHVFVLLNHRLVHVGTTKFGLKFPEDLADKLDFAGDQSLFYDIYCGSETCGLTSHASAPYFIVVRREIEGQFLEDLALTWKANVNGWAVSKAAIESAMREFAGTKNSAIQEELASDILGTAVLAKFCDRKEEFNWAYQQAKLVFDEPHFALFVECLSRAKPVRVYR